MLVSADNYNPLANVDDGSCQIEGCMDEAYIEYDTYVNTNNPAYCLTIKVYGCTNSIAFNYNPDANTDDGSCVPTIYGCTTLGFDNYNPLAVVLDTCINGENIEIQGCTDESYYEYNPMATIDTLDNCINYCPSFVWKGQNSNFNGRYG